MCVLTCSYHSNASVWMLYRLAAASALASWTSFSGLQAKTATWPAVNTSSLLSSDGVDSTFRLSWLTSHRPGLSRIPSSGS